MGFRIPGGGTHIEIDYFGAVTTSYLETHNLDVAAPRSYDVSTCHEAYVLATDTTSDVVTPQLPG